MYQRARYFSNRFIRNGIAGFAISAFLVYSVITGAQSTGLIIIIFPVVSFVWLYFGLRIKSKLKSKDPNETPEIRDELFSYRQAQSIFSILVGVILISGINHWKYSYYFTVPVLIVFVWWFYLQMKLLNDYFKK
jgi:uncharacterized membrane protein